MLLLCCLSPVSAMGRYYLMSYHPFLYFCFGGDELVISVTLSAVGKLPSNARAVSMNHSWRLI